MRSFRSSTHLTLRQELRAHPTAITTVTTITESTRSARIPTPRTRAYIDDGFRHRPVLARWLGISAKAIYELNIVPVLLRVLARPLENKSKV
jgi:hypothetical protein